MTILPSKGGVCETIEMHHVSLGKLAQLPGKRPVTHFSGERIGREATALAGNSRLAICFVPRLNETAQAPPKRLLSVLHSKKQKKHWVTGSRLPHLTGRFLLEQPTRPIVITLSALKVNSICQTSKQVTSTDPSNIVSSGDLTRREAKASPSLQGTWGEPEVTPQKSQTRKK